MDVHRKDSGSSSLNIVNIAHSVPPLGFRLLVSVVYLRVNFRLVVPQFSSMYFNIDISGNITVHIRTVTATMVYIMKNLRRRRFPVPPQRRSSKHPTHLQKPNSKGRARYESGFEQGSVGAGRCGARRKGDLSLGSLRKGIGLRMTSVICIWMSRKMGG